MSKRYHIFISHSWSYGSQYEDLKALLDKDNTFSYSDYSVPKDDPIHDADDDNELRAAIRDQMIPCSVVLMLAGVYATYSKWINEEIDLARNSFFIAKPIIAVEYWGSLHTSKNVKDAASKVVKWQSKSIIKAIRELG